METQIQAQQLVVMACRKLFEAQEGNLRDPLPEMTPQGHFAELYPQQHQHVFRCPYISDDYFHAVRDALFLQDYPDTIFSIVEEAVMHSAETTRYILIKANRPLDTP
jgi:hypothetical protein